MTDIKMPEKGSRYTARRIPATILTIKHMRIAKLKMVITAAQFSFASIQEPMNLPAARSTKKMEIA